MSARVSFVIVSHSASLAAGVCELAAQMAPDVRFEAAGGTDDGRIGTSYDLVETALEAALAAVDESVIEMSDDPERVRFVDTALVEGAVTSSVRAQVGDDLDQVAEAAAALAPRLNDAPAQEAPSPATVPVSGGAGEAPASLERCVPHAEGDAVVADPVGLHARPAAAFTRLAATFDAEITVNGVDATSMLLLMTLGVGQGTTVHIEANGADATAAVAALTDMLERTN